MVGVGGVDRYETAADLFGLVRGGVHHAAPVEQHQRVARTQIPQVERADIPPARIDAPGDVLGFVKEVLTVFRDQCEQFIARVNAHDLDIFDAYDTDSEGIADRGASDLRANDDDFLDFRFVLRQCGAGKHGHGCGQSVPGEFRHCYLSPCALNRAVFNRVILAQFLCLQQVWFAYRADCVRLCRTCHPWRAVRP